MTKKEFLQFKQLLIVLTSYHDVRIDDGGEGIFILFFKDPSWDEKRIYSVCTSLFEDVQWCPDPETHSEKAVAVLNCFYPREEV